jgi:hypothetical protein
MPPSINRGGAGSCTTVPGPCKPPILEANGTGRFTSYKHRTDHELATLSAILLVMVAIWVYNSNILAI